MLKFKVTGDGGRVLIGLGLSAENIKRLKAGDPMFFQLDDLGLEGVDVTILYGYTEKTLKDKLAKLGLKGFGF